MEKDTQTLVGKIFSGVLILVAVGTLFYRFVEDLSWVDSFYFTVITLTTVGYGDISPVTTFGKLFTVFYVVIGIGIFSYFISSVVTRRQKRKEKRAKERKKNK